MKRLIGIIVAMYALASATMACGLATASSAMPPCQPSSPLECSVIDGFPVGVLAADCGADGASCGDLATLARFALDSRDPNHEAITAVQQYDIDLARVCGPVVCALSGQHSIVVFTFAGGSYRAIGYECPGISSCRATFAWGDYGGGVERPSP